MIKYKLGATIPTAQYGNLIPEIELEGEDKNELHDEASKFIEDIWKQYGSVPMTKNSSGGKKVSTFTGEEILYDEVNHKYFDLNGKQLLSASGYADKNSPKFDVGSILPKTAKAWGVDEKDLGKLWELNGFISTEYGSSVHTALEVYHKYHKIGEQVQKAKELEYNYALPKNEHLRDVVLAFQEKFGLDAMTEVLVSDVENGMAGQIDRLQVSGKVCRIGDYKTNNDMDEKKLKKYQLQLNFYAHILMNKGYKVEGLDIFHWNGKDWEVTVLEVSELIK